jgi:hypothetical protein
VLLDIAGTNKCTVLLDIAGTNKCRWQQDGVVCGVKKEQMHGRN